MEKISIPEIYGMNVFNDAVMRERLPKKIYKEFKDTIQNGDELKPEVAEVIANAMKDWAIERGATHYTHWFQPMTGITAEKHDAFISPTKDGKAIMEFSGKELIKGEPDASSFPSGGLRGTFEARGYSVWDCTSPAFLKEDASGVTLCIPTAFCSYTGEALDKKTPLLRSMQAINTQALRILRLFGDTETKKVTTSVGPEQEYFLIDKDLYDQRKDLIFTGRTLFGAVPPKGQQLDDHYFGTIKEKIACFMHDLDIECWKLGISAKTEHNEVAPSQHELAPIYDDTNVATDHNQLIMEYMKKLAPRHGLVCLLHEKPFAGVNGSGKHNNWSIATDGGQNLLDPGKEPHKNKLFLTFLLAVIKAVDEYAPLLRLSASNPGNEHRLGAQEAPPAIVSVFLGEQLEDILKQIEAGNLTNSKKGENMSIGVNTLPRIKKDATDRNRTSPFAFTGNKFEFRMVPSSASIAGPNFVLNTIVADALKDFADELEGADDFDSALAALMQKTVKEHKKVIFNGNGYSDEWIAEAEKRGLPNLKSMVDAIPYYTMPKTVKMFSEHGVLTKAEVESRAEIKYEDYINKLTIEAKTMLDMIAKQIKPAVIAYAKSLADAIASLNAVGADASVETELLNSITKENNALNDGFKEIKSSLDNAETIDDLKDKANAFKNNVFVAMNKARKAADDLEMLVDEEYWPFPTYGDILFNV
ncbi:MAG: glutamine synthetase III [Clostridia bacterium]|nr:glutamine synthetase III [Clostridia bacterium]MCI2001182.1 glutamine synthetase III [Clostridia bacterium]MCI2015872.1 glutamine synthetase III [Clostridia bacterium]